MLMAYRAKWQFRHGSLDMVKLLQRLLQRAFKIPLNKRHKTLMASNRHFAIDSQLLGDPSALPWSNLGFWPTSCPLNSSYLNSSHLNSSYITACQQLAHQIGIAAQLQANDKLLDLGCGHGASLAYWHAEFGVAHMSAFEIQADCIARIKQAVLPQLEAIYQASFSQLPLPAPQLQRYFDVVVCVDAAYHAPLEDFLAVNQAVLTAGGRIAFTTLIQPQHSPAKNHWVKHLLPSMLKLVAIPKQQLDSEIQVRALLTHFDFTNIHIEHVDNEVLNGFAQYIQRHPLPLHRKHLAAWLKIRLTAQLCGVLYRHQLAHYSIVSARYGPNGL